MLWPGLASFYSRSTTQSRSLDRLIGLSNACGIFLVSGILFGGEVLAAPPNPPVILGDNVIVVDSNANRINAILDDYTVPAILSGLQYPADPVTTTTHEVRNNSELAAAVGGDGRLIRIYGPGNGGQTTYNQFDLGGRSDIDIVMDNDATISGSTGWSWWGAVRRLRWTGGNIHIATGMYDGFRIQDIEDALFDDVHMYRDNGTEGHVFYPGNLNHRRFAMINSTVEQLAGTDSNSYGVFSSTNGETSSDWIFLNNYFRGQGGSIRFQYRGLRTAIVGNYFETGTGVAGSVRIHETTDKLWFAHNVSIHGGGNQPSLAIQVSSQGADNSFIMNDVRIESNRLFATQSDINAGSVYRLGDVVVSNQDQATNWVMLNNIWSDPSGPAGGATFGGVNISGVYVREGDLRVGPGHPEYIPAPLSRAGFGATR